MTIAKSHDLYNMTGLPCSYEMEVCPQRWYYEPKRLRLHLHQDDRRGRLVTTGLCDYVKLDPGFDYYVSGFVNYLLMVNLTHNLLSQFCLIDCF